MIKKLINRSINLLGYQIVKKPSLELNIKRGDYKWLSLESINTIIDVGANDGGFAVMINKILPDAAIYSFEPIKDVFENLSRNTSAIKNIKLFNTALGEEETEKEFHINEFSASSSFLEMDKLHVQSFPYTAQNRKEKITVKKLDSFADAIDFKPNVLLKLDVQGYELNVLKGALKILDRVNLIIMEVSFLELYNSQPLFHEVYQFLYEQGFNFSGNFDQLHDPATNRILQADAIFTRR
jgi:FkbM family methyltransferase